MRSRLTSKGRICSSATIPHPCSFKRDSHNHFSRAFYYTTLEYNSLVASPNAMQLNFLTIA